MSSRSSIIGKGGSNNIDRIYNLSSWLSFQHEQTEKRFLQEYIQRQRYSYIGIVIFNVVHIIYGFLTLSSLTSLLFPILTWLMTICLLISIQIMYMQAKNKYIEQNNLFQILIRLSSFYYYISQYLNADHLEQTKTATFFMNTAISVSLHMILTNMLTVPHWKKHLIINFATFFIVQIVVNIASNDNYIQFDLLFFVLTQGSLTLFSGFFEKFIREMWIHLDVSKKQSVQLQNIIDDIPQPLLILDINCDVILTNFAGLKFFQAILPQQENEAMNNRNANNSQKILHRLNPEDLKVIENLVKQVKESDKICTVTFQKKQLESSESSKPIQLTFVGSAIQWKATTCTLLQVQEAEKIIEKEIEKKTITIERVYEVENPVPIINPSLVDSHKNEKDSLLNEPNTTSIQLVQPPPPAILQSIPKPPRNLTQVDNIYSINLGSASSPKQKKKTNYNLSSPNQSPINFISPQNKISVNISEMSSTQDNSEGEVNINVDEEIYKHFSFIEQGLSSLLVQIISKIQNIKGKKINLSFGSLDNSPGQRQQSGISSHHNMISGNKLFNTSINTSGHFNNKNQELPSPDKLSNIEKIGKDKIVNVMNRILKIQSEHDNKIIQKDSEKLDNNGENKEQKNIFNDELEYQLNDSESEEENRLQNKKKDNSPPQQSPLPSSNQSPNQSSRQITVIKEEDEGNEAIVSNRNQINHIQYKYNSICTIILFEESQNVRGSIPYFQYDHPKKFHTFSEGQLALNLYLENIKQGTLFHFIVLGIENTVGISGFEVMSQIRNYEKENLVPRTYLVALFNAVGSEIGGQTKSADTYLFQGFDRAFEKPFTRNIANDLIKERMSPPIIYSTEEDFILKYKYQNKFTVLICDDVIQTSMVFKDYAQQSNVECEIAKSQKSLLNQYYASIEAGKLYQIIMIAINSTIMSGIEIVKKIREYETEHKAKRTYVVGMYKSLNETIGKNLNSNSPQKYKEEGFDDIIDKPLEKDAVCELIQRVKKQIQQEEENNQKNNVSSISSLNNIKSPIQNKSNTPSITQIPKQQKRVGSLSNLSQSQLTTGSNNEKQQIIFQTPISKQSQSKAELDDDIEMKANIFNNVKKQGIKIGESSQSSGNNTASKLTDTSNNNISQPQSGNKSQTDFDKLEMSGNIFSKVKNQGFKFGGNSEQPQTNNTQNNTTQQAQKNQAQIDLDEQELNAGIFNKVKSSGFKIGGGNDEQAKLNTSQNSTQSQKSKPQIDLDELELNASIFNKVKSQGIKIGGNSQQPSTNNNNANTQQQKNQAQIDLDELELNASIFNKVKSQGIKIGGNTEQSKQENVNSNATQAQQKNQAQIDLDEQEMNASIFSKVKSQGLKIGGDSDSQKPIQQQVSQNNSGIDFLKKLEEKDQSKYQNNKQTSDGDRLSEQAKLKQNFLASQQQFNKKTLERYDPNSNSSMIKSVLQNEDFKKNNQKEQDNDKLELSHANNLFSSLNKKGIKFSGSESASSNTSSTQVSNNNTPNMIISQRPSLQQKQSSNKSDQNSGLNDSQSSNSNKNSPNTLAQFKQQNNSPSAIKASLNKFDEIQQNEKKLQQQYQQQQRQQEYQDEEDEQNEMNNSKEPSPILNKQNIQKQLQKNDGQQPVKQSPQLSLSKLSRSPVQTFQSKPPSSQLQMLAVKPATTTQYKYSDKPCILVMEDSSFTMTNIVFMKYEIPKQLDTCNNGDAAFEKYLNKLSNNIIYNFILLAVKTQSGTNGNDIMLKIRQHEKDNNLPRTHIIGLFNSISDDIGGQSCNKDTFIFRGFDDAIEKPIRADVMNKLLKSRANPEMIFTKKEDYIPKYTFYEKFSILVCDETDQISLNLSTIEIENVDRPNFTWSGQSLIDNYLTAINGGKMYQVIFTGIRPLDLNKEDVIQRIRSHEKQNNIPQTYIIGFVRLNQKGSPTVEELKQEGYNEIIDSSINQEGLEKLIIKLKLQL